MDKYIGIDLGGSKIRFNDVDLKGSVGKERQAIVNSGIDNKGLTELILRNTEEVIKMVHKEGNRIGGIGFGSPGPLNYKKGIIETPPNLPKINKLSVVKILAESFPEYPAFLVHDADAALLGEQSKGAAKGFENVAMVIVGTGIGSSVVLDNKLVRGKGRASEAGHSDVYAGRDVRTCSCGRENHWEPYINTDGLVRTYCRAFKLNYYGLSEEKKYDVSYLLREEMKKNTEDAQNIDLRWLEVIDKYCAHFVSGLRNMLANFDPECIVLGGGIMTGNELLLKAITEKWNNDLFGIGKIREFKDKMAPMGIGTQLRLAQLPNAGVIGAAKYAMDQLKLTQGEV